MASSSSISDLTRRKALASAAFWKWEKIWRRLINLSCYQNQAVQHHLCDSALIWMWILGTVCQHAKQDKCIRYILLQDHAKYQASWSCKQCKNPWDDEHPAPHQHCKTAPTVFPWAHPHDARWRTMQEICSLSSNSWQKETRVTKDKLQIVHPEAARGYRKWSAFRYNCLASFRSLSLEKICSHLLFSRMMIMTSNPSLDWPPYKQVKTSSSAEMISHPL